MSQELNCFLEIVSWWCCDPLNGLCEGFGGWCWAWLSISPYEGCGDVLNGSDRISVKDLAGSVVEGDNDLTHSSTPLSNFTVQDPTTLIFWLLAKEIVGFCSFVGLIVGTLTPTSPSDDSFAHWFITLSVACLNALSNTWF